MERKNEIEKQLDSLIGSEGYYERIVSELGDALQAIASPGEELNCLDVRMRVLGTIAEVRSDMQYILKVLSGVKSCTE